MLESRSRFFARLRSALLFALPCAFGVTILGPGVAHSVEVTRGPYLQLATPSSVTVRWRTDEAVPSRVLYGPAPSALHWVVQNATRTTEHELTVRGLPDDRRYYYAIATDLEVLAGGDFDHTFATAPPPGSPRPTRVWVIGDSGTADEDAAAVRDAFLSYAGGAAPDVWLMLGDNAYDDGEDEEYQEAVFEMFPQLLRGTFLWPSRGNHDRSEETYYGIFTLPSAGEAGGVASGTEAYYSFDHGDIHFVCLDSEGSDRSDDGDMATWLRTDLAAHGREWVIAYWHHPPYSKGSHDSDDDDQLQDMRENIVPILEAGGVDLVLCGHSHAYERSYLIRGHYGDSDSFDGSMQLDPGDGREAGNGCYRTPPVGSARRGAVYAVVGCSGRLSGGDLDHPAMVFSLEELGSMVIDVTGHRLDARFIDDRGVVRDEFSIVRAARPMQRPTLREGGPRIVLSGPNPAPSGAELEYTLPGAGRASLSIFTVAGRQVASVRADHGPGSHRVAWDGRDMEGRRTPAGVYFAELRWGGERRLARFVKLD